MERLHDVVLSAKESSLVDQVLQQSKYPGILDAQTAFWVFSGDRSNLPNHTLGRIWDISDTGKKGHLTRQEVGVALRLMGWAQNGYDIHEHLVSQNGPLAFLSGISPKDTPMARSVSPLPPVPAPPPPPPRPRTSHSHSDSSGLMRAPSLRTRTASSPGPGPSMSSAALLTPHTPSIPFPQPPIVLTPPSPPPSPPPPSSSFPQLPVSPAPTSPTSSASSSVQFESSSSSSSASPHIELRPLTEEYRVRYHSAFYQAKPENGLLPGPKAWHLFLRSRLPVNTLLRIWDCASPLDASSARCDLDVEEFTLAMYLIHGMMDGALDTVPDRAQLPPDVLPAPRSDIEGMTTPPSTTMNLPARAFSMDFRRYLKTEEDQSVLPVLPKEIYNFSSKYFDFLADTDDDRISGDVAEPFMLVSQVPLEELSRIWDLADYQCRGSLDRKGFAIALFFVYKRMANQNIPEFLPPSFLSDKKAKRRSSGMSDEVAREHRRMRSLSVIQPDNKHLLSQIADLRASLEARTLENDALRKANSSGEKGGDDARQLLDELSLALQEKDILVRKLREARDENASHRTTNEILQNQVQHVKEQLRISRVDADTMTQMLREDLERETADLRRQIDEMRASSASVPSSGGDEDLQHMINEQLSMENGQLRKQVEDLQDAMAKISLQQEPAASTSASASNATNSPPTPRPSSIWWADSRPKDEMQRKGKEKETDRKKTKLRRRTAEELEKFEKERAAQEAELKRQIQELETRASEAETDLQRRLGELQAQSDEREASLRRRVEDLERLNEALRRRPAVAAQSASTQREEDMAPPAYSDVA